MNEIINFLLILFGYLVPLYLSNSTPVLIHGKIPLDLKLKLKTNRIFGDGKTILGTLVAIIAGLLAGIIYNLLFNVDVLISNYYFLLILLVMGAVLGDITESFFKRRIGLSRGAKWDIFDQTDFIIGGLLLSLIARIPEIEIVILILILTYFVHRASNYFAYKIKIKKVPW